VADKGAVNEEEFRRLCDFVYRRTGMVFTEAKRYYVERRVSDRMAATGAKSFASYFARLRTDAQGEVEQFINAFTVNETYFYREDHQLRCLTGDLLPARTRGKARGAGLRIWSAPCSTGEEPYSIAMWLLENWAEVDAYDIEIVGSDIDTRALEAAREGVFGRRALMRLTPELIDRYFVQLDDERWRILDQFDVIFCRNMLIYFDDASRRVAAENLFEALAPGGFICLGHSESMSRISPLFEVARYSDAIVYRRPMEEPHG
jgi:chemotaxis protein methyltransferase CheR